MRCFLGILNDFGGLGLLFLCFLNLGSLLSRPDFDDFEEDDDDELDADERGFLSNIFWSNSILMFSPRIVGGGGGVASEVDVGLCLDGLLLLDRCLAGSGGGANFRSFNVSILGLSLISNILANSLGNWSFFFLSTMIFFEASLELEEDEA